MKIGMLARSEHRGLGNMSREFYRHIQPDKTLVIIPDAVLHAHLTSHVDWYPGATLARYSGVLEERLCREWLDGLDVVYTAETFYDWRFCQWAREQGVATVCHVMPEWMRPEWAEQPTAWWAPTSWRLDLLPDNTRLVPVPIPTDRFTPAERKAGPFRWLHVAGATLKAHRDRNGTNSVILAGRALDPNQEVVIRTQSPGYSPLSPNVMVAEAAVDDYTELYRGFDALVMPRRYAGLCLPVLEAFAAGLPVVMTDMSPQNTDWPVETVPTIEGQPIRMMGGRIPTGNVDVQALAEKMNRWASAPSEVDYWRKRAAKYVAANSWEVRAPQILAELEVVADLVAA